MTSSLQSLAAVALLLSSCTYSLQWWKLDIPVPETAPGNDLYDNLVPQPEDVL